MDKGLGRLRIKRFSEESDAVSLPKEIVSSARALEYAPHRYFKIEGAVKTVPIVNLTLTRMRPEGIANAVVLMRLAFQGRHDRRPPVRIRKSTENRFLVVDGNSTVAIAAAAGWPDVPCVVDE